FGERVERLDAVVLLLADLAPMQARAGRRCLSAAVLAGQEAAREREVGDEAEAEALAGREQLALGVAFEQRVLALLRDVWAFGQPCGFLQLRRTVVRCPVGASLPLAHELVERADRLVERSGGVL